MILNSNNLRDSSDSNNNKDTDIERGGGNIKND
jgi:hypothetical protein